MKITFLGVGEACDEWLPNTSILVQSRAGGEPRMALLDCGFSVPAQFLRLVSDPEALDGLWISHFHGDHFFGAPQLLLRFWQEGRRKPLAIIGPAGVREVIENCMEMAFAGVLEKVGYPLKYHVMKPGSSLNTAGFGWNAAESSHGKPCLAVRISDGETSLFYCGDGRATPQSEQLARGCDLAVHESYYVHPGEKAGHGSVAECIQFARRAGVKKLALVHLSRDVRRNQKLDIEALMAEATDVKVFLPEPGDGVVY